MPTLYVLHFAWPYWETRPGVGARHYVGYTSNGLDARLEAHRRGRGSKLVAYALARGNGFQVVHQEEHPDQPAARARELQIKRSHNIWTLCPICKAERKEVKANELLVRKVHQVGVSPDLVHEGPAVPKLL